LGLAYKYEAIASGKPFDILYTLDENDWNGNKSIQMKVIDIRPSIENN
jgi:single-stranded-DNA-specific exonuclease